MEKQQLRFGFDRCPATSNMVQPNHCNDCDFKGSCNNERCECKFFASLIKKQYQKA